jgi:hypothetical protein
VVFFTIALAAYGWNFFNAPPVKSEIPLEAAAKVRIHDPNFAYQKVWQEILAQAKTEVRENVRMEAQRSGQETVVAISLSNLPAETIVPMVNVVAAAYSRACRAEWKLHLEQTCSAAAEKLRQAEGQAQKAQALFETLRDRRMQALAFVKPVAPPTMIENPRWTEISRHLAELEDQRRILLFERTPQHPAVQEKEMQINDARRELASIPQKIAQGQPAPAAALPPVDAPALADVQAAQQAAEGLKDELRQAQAMERAAQTARGEELRVDLLAAEPLPAAPRDTGSIFGRALLAATTSTFGLGMISLGAALEPPLASVAELQALLSVPIVGVIPSATPGRRAASPLARRLARWGAITAGLAVLLSVAWLLVGG